MTLQQLQKDMIAAMKSGEKVRKNVISSLIAAVKSMPLIMAHATTSQKKLQIW